MVRFVDFVFDTETGRKERERERERERPARRLQHLSPCAMVNPALDIGKNGHQPSHQPLLSGLVISLVTPDDAS